LKLIEAGSVQSRPSSHHEDAPAEGDRHHARTRGRVPVPRDRPPSRRSQSFDPAFVPSSGRGEALDGSPFPSRQETSLYRY
jgi:hypothetical protein